MIEDIRNRVYRLVSDVLGVEVGAINDDSSPDTIASWDSVTHINLILALEDEFGVSLSDEDVMEMLSVGLIQRILLERGAQDSG